jgi:hypothetical protein
VSKGGLPARRHQQNNLKETALMIEAIATTTPVLAAGWSLLYMLFGGGVGGAFLIFLGLKAIGR